MKLDGTSVVLQSLLALTWGLTPTVSIAQIVPDSSLPVNSIVAPNGNTFTIDGGTAAGANLFHSFSDFSLPTGTEAFFNNSLDVQNIFSRVTGGNISNIDGLIRANGGASLFLLNPAGIVFGPNARLDIGGSFLGTTANSVVFENGVEFNASSQVAPLLTISVPLGLQFNGQVGAIQVRGNGHNLTADNPTFPPIERDNISSGLQVNPGQTLALLGGDVLLDGATVIAEGGHIELGAVETGFVGLTTPNEQPNGQWHFNYDGVSRFQDIDLVRQAAVDASGSEIGSMQIVGGRVALSDGSIALLQNQGTQTFGTLQVRAAESLTLAGINPEGFPAGIRQETVGVGNGGDIDVSTPQLLLRDGGQIFNGTLGEGNSGNIDVRVSESIELIGTSPLNFRVASAIIALTSGTGSSGDVTLSGENLSLRSGGRLSTLTSGSGSGGQLTVNVTDTIEIFGIALGSTTPSLITAPSFGSGNAGSITVNTSRALLQDGGEISSSAFGEGNGGRVVVNATELVELSQTASGTLPSIIDSSAERASIGLQRAFGAPPIPSGASGNVEIATPQLTVTDEGLVSVRNEGIGNAGNLNVNADLVLLDRGGGITASTESGEGGNIQLSLDGLQLRNGSFISARAGGTGSGGNIAIDSNTIALLENSQINANAVRGEGGNIQITTRGLFASGNSSITASSQFGVDGAVTITNPDVAPNAGLVNLPENVLDPADRVVAGCETLGDSEFIATGRGGVPANPNRPLASSRTWSDVRDLSEFRGETVESASVRVETPERLVEATGWRVNEDGTVELVATANPSPSGNLAASGCDPVRNND